MRKPSDNFKTEYCDQCGRAIFENIPNETARNFRFGVTQGMMIHNPNNQTFFCSTHCVEKFQPQVKH